MSPQTSIRLCRHLGQVARERHLHNFVRDHHSTANELLATIHDRMPVILSDDSQERWLRSDALPSELRDMLVPFPGVQDEELSGKFAGEQRRG